MWFLPKGRNKLQTFRLSKLQVEDRSRHSHHNKAAPSPILSVLCFLATNCRHFVRFSPSWKTLIFSPTKISLRIKCLVEAHCETTAWRLVSLYLSVKVECSRFVYNNWLALTCEYIIADPYTLGKSQFKEMCSFSNLPGCKQVIFIWTSEASLGLTSTFRHFIPKRSFYQNSRPTITFLYS